MFDFIDPLFAGQLGLIIASGITFVGISEILMALMVWRKKAFGGDNGAAARFRPVFFVVLFSGFLITCVGLYGLDLHFGTRL
jgi:hypothetical protein